MSQDQTPALDLDGLERVARAAYEGEHPRAWDAFGDEFLPSVCLRLIAAARAEGAPAAEGKEEAERIRRSALHDADDISGRIHKGGYRANLSDVECLRNHVRKLAALPNTPAPAAEPVRWEVLLGDAWEKTHESAVPDARKNGFQVRALYASPPQQPVEISREELAGAVQAEGRTIAAQALLELGYHYQDDPEGISPAAYHIADAILSKLDPTATP